MARGATRKIASKECQLDLFADRTSTATLRANQLRLYFASFAYVPMHGLRRLGLAGTGWARAQCGTLRVRLLKVAAPVRVTARKVWLSWSSAYPYADEFAAAAATLARGPTRDRPCSSPRPRPSARRPSPALPSGDGVRHGTGGNPPKRQFQRSAARREPISDTRQTARVARRTCAQPQTPQIALPTATAGLVRYQGWPRVDHPLASRHVPGLK